MDAAIIYKEKQGFLQFLVMTAMVTLFIFPILGLEKLRIPLLVLITLVFFFTKITQTNLFFLMIMTPIIGIYFFYFYNSEFRTHLMSYWVIALIGLMYGEHVDFIVKCLKVFLLVNLVLVIYEFFKADFLWNISGDAYYGRAKGLFSAPKEAGMFLSIYIALFFRKMSFLELFLLFVTSFFIGSRTLLLMCVVSFFLQFLSVLRDPGKLSFYVKIAFIAILLLILALNSGILMEYFEVLGRLDTLLNMKEGGNDLRLYVLKENIRLYSEGTLPQTMLGLGTKVEELLHNGAENAFLNVLVRYGVLGFLFFVSTLAMVFVKRNDAKKFLMLILVVLLVGNRGLAGFLDGFVFFAFIGSIFFKTNKPGIQAEVA